MRSRFFRLFSSGGGGWGGGSGCVTSTTSTAGATRAFRRTERVAAGAAGAGDICFIRAACGDLGLGVILVALGEGSHAARRAAALAAGVREDVRLRGRARELRRVKVGVSTEFGGAEER
jgi:hypothetical protein